MNQVQARALRRTMTMSAALAATLLAHFLAMGHVAVLPIAPVLWGTLLLSAALIGGRGSFTPRSAVRTGALLVTLQALLHMVLVVAPWSLGLAVHHEAMPLMDGRSLVVHAVAALVLTLILRTADRALAIAVHAIRVFLGRSLPPRAARRTTRVPAPVSLLRSRIERRTRCTRGPPGLAAPAAG